MARSRANLVLSPIAGLAAREMERKHAIPSLPAYVSYDLREIARTYEALADFLEVPAGRRFDFAPHRARAEAAARAAREAVGGRPVYVSGVLKPFGLAEALSDWGFSVAGVVDEVVKPFEREACSHVCAAHFLPQHPETIWLPLQNPDAIAVGFDAAYLVGTPHIVDAAGDHGLYGYDGVCKLMARFEEAASKEEDLRGLIDRYGIVV